jgi:hypothetical protein
LGLLPNFAQFQNLFWATIEALIICFVWTILSPVTIILTPTPVIQILHVEFFMQLTVKFGAFAQFRPKFTTVNKHEIRPI